MLPIDLPEGLSHEAHARRRATTSDLPSGSGPTGYSLVGAFGGVSVQGARNIVAIESRRGSLPTTSGELSVPRPTTLPEGRRRHASELFPGHYEIRNVAFAASVQGFDNEFIVYRGEEFLRQHSRRLSSATNSSVTTRDSRAASRHSSTDSLASEPLPAFRSATAVNICGSIVIQGTRNTIHWRIGSDASTPYTPDWPRSIRRPSATGSLSPGSFYPFTHVPSSPPAARRTRFRTL